MQKSEVNKQTFRSLYIGINAILGMVTTNRVNLVQVCSLNIEQSRLLQKVEEDDKDENEKCCDKS